MRNSRGTLDALVFEVPREPEVWESFFAEIQTWPELKKRFIFIGEHDRSLIQARSEGYMALEKPVRPAILLGLIYKLPPLN